MVYGGQDNMQEFYSHLLHEVLGMNSVKALAIKCCLLDGKKQASKTGQEASVARWAFYFFLAL